MSSNKILVIGGGISGVSLAAHFCKENQNVTLIDNQINHSSLIAAGQINPLVFRRMNKSWRVDEFIPYCKQFYAELEQYSHSKIYHPLIIRRLFSSEQEKEMWIEKQASEAFYNYMEVINEDDDNYNHAFNEFGSGRVKNASYIDASAFLSACKQFITENKGQIKYEQFDYNSFNPESNTYKGEKFKHVIFCEGYLNQKNPWFNYLPVRTTKGETLTINSENLNNDEGLNRKCFIIPVGGHAFRVGATYVWKTDDLTLTTEGKNELIEKFEKLSSYPYEIIDHKAGIRPTTPDRRPIIGSHPNNENMFIFNGLGSKGYMTAPLLAKEFVDHILYHKPLDKEVQIGRFKNKK